jgi:hypothetical protein
VEGLLEEAAVEASCLLEGLLEEEASCLLEARCLLKASW